MSTFKSNSSDDGEIVGYNDEFDESRLIKKIIRKRLKENEFKELKPRPVNVQNVIGVYAACNIVEHRLYKIMGNMCPCQRSFNGGLWHYIEHIPLFSLQVSTPYVINMIDKEIFCLLLRAEEDDYKNRYYYIRHIQKISSFSESSRWKIEMGLAITLYKLEIND